MPGVSARNFWGGFPAVHFHWISPRFAKFQVPSWCHCAGKRCFQVDLFKGFQRKEGSRGPATKVFFGRG